MELGRLSNSAWFNFSTSFWALRMVQWGDWSTGRHTKLKNQIDRRDRDLIMVRADSVLGENTKQRTVHRVVYSFGSWETIATSMKSWSRGICHTKFHCEHFHVTGSVTRNGRRKWNEFLSTHHRLTLLFSFCDFVRRHPVAENSQFTMASPQIQNRDNRMKCVCVCCYCCCSVLIPIKRKFPIDGDGNVSETKMKTFV